MSDGEVVRVWEFALQVTLDVATAEAAAPVIAAIVAATLAELHPKVIEVELLGQRPNQRRLVDHP